MKRALLGLAPAALAALLLADTEALGIACPGSMRMPFLRLSRTPGHLGAS